MNNPDMLHSVVEQAAFRLTLMPETPNGTISLDKLKFAEKYVRETMRTGSSVIVTNLDQKIVVIGTPGRPWRTVDSDGQLVESGEADLLALLRSRLDGSI